MSSSSQAFIQTVLRISVFQFEFPNVIKHRWGSQDALASTMSSWRNPGGGSGGKSPEKFWPFDLWRTNKLLKIEETL